MFQKTLGLKKDKFSNKRQWKEREQSAVTEHGTIFLVKGWWHIQPLSVNSYFYMKKLVSYTEQEPDCAKGWENEITQCPCAQYSFTVRQLILTF